MTQNALQTPPAVRGAAAWFDRFFWPVAAALLALRLFLNTRFDLVPDEAFYWTWTRHLSAGYFDHPPMIAWLIWLSTRALGNTELAVRLPAAVLTLGALAILHRIAGKLLADSRAVGFVILMWICGPLLAALGSIHTPDASATFFSVCALACAVAVARRDDEMDAHRRVGAAGFRRVRTADQNLSHSDSQRGLSDADRRRNGYADGPQCGPYNSVKCRWSDNAGLWLAFGLFSGLALLSKYTTVLVPGGVGLAMLTSRRGWRHLQRPWIYMAAVLALAIFSPVIFWNARHQWASFRFQLAHGAGEGITGGLHGFRHILLARMAGLAQFVGGQALVWTPILFGLAIIVLVNRWSAAIESIWRPAPSATYADNSGRLSRLGNVEWLLLWCGTLPLLFFGWAATRSHGEINWPAFAYFPISLLIGQYLSENWGGSRVQWIKLGCQVALGFLIGMHLLAMPSVQLFLLARHVPLTHQVTDVSGWRNFARQVVDRAQRAPVICNRHQDAGELAFYLPGQPDVWCDGIGSRTTAFDYFDEGRPDYSRMPRLLFVGGHVGMFMAEHHYTHKKTLEDLLLPGRRDRAHSASMVEN